MPRTLLRPIAGRSTAPGMHVPHRDNVGATPQVARRDDRFFPNLTASAARRAPLPPDDQGEGVRGTSPASEYRVGGGGGLRSDFLYRDLAVPALDHDFLDRDLPLETDGRILHGPTVFDGIDKDLQIHV